MTGTQGERSRAPSLLAAAAFLLTLLPGLLGPYGAFIDELYYVSCAKRLAWGYVDHPPFAPFVLRLSRGLFGDGLFAVRLPVAVAGALLVLLVGRVARRLGAGALGQSIACLSVVASPLLLLMFGFFSVNAFEILLWTLLLAILVEIELRSEPRLWLLFGAVGGVALLDKHTVVLLVGGLAAGLLLTRARRHLASPWLWVGVAIAALMALPNVLWEATRQWPSLEFYRNAGLYKQTRISPLEVLAQQVLFLSPGILPIWVLGLVRLWRRRAGIGLRHVTVAYLTLLVAMVVSGQSRPDRIFGFYPVLLAAGGAGFESWLRGAIADRPLSTRGRVWLGAALFWLLAWAVVLAPVAMPILSPERTAAWAGRIGVQPQMEQGAGKKTPLPQWFADRVGWPQLVADVAEVRDRLSPEERSQVVFFAPSYGQAGALDWLGRDLGLAPVYAGHNTWYLWGPPHDPTPVAIVLGFSREDVEGLFEEVELAKVHECGLCMPWRNHMPIWIARKPRVAIADYWQDWKHYE